MKQFILTGSLFLFFIASIAQSVAINSDGATPHPSALLDLKSNTKGLLIPRMTTVERNAIVSPAAGLMIYQTDGVAGYHFYNGSNWISMAGGGPAGNQWILNGTGLYNNNTGNVGIGISNPTATLDVARGTASQGSAIFRGTTHISHFNYSTNEDTYIRGGKNDSYVYINDAFNINRQGLATINGSQYASLAFKPGGLTAGEIYGQGRDIMLQAYRTQLVTVPPGNICMQVSNPPPFEINAGNVGIGTNTPQAKLHVVGDILLQGTFHDQRLANGSSPVFQKNYRLPSLEEVEAFINKNNHLQGLPSGKEIMEDGIYINDMLLALMQKVEELTLYTIELKKEINRLQRQPVKVVDLSIK